MPKGDIGVMTEPPESETGEEYPEALLQEEVARVIKDYLEPFPSPFQVEAF